MNCNIKRTLEACLIGLILFSGCKQATTPTEKTIPSQLPVTVTAANIGQMVTYTELSATSAFLFKASVKAPVTGYIDKMLINQGDVIKKNQLLFTIKTKEASALQDDSINTMKFSGIVNVNASTDGVILSIEHPRGDFVSEGDPLGQIAIPGSLAFILDVPFELSGSIKLKTPCEIELPDKQMIKGTIQSRFPSMAGSSQTERFIVRITSSISLPENLVSKIKIVKELIKNAVSLPKSCILTDETMQRFWVMQLINDSTAIKVPVTTGITAMDSVQITSPAFNTGDLFLSSGNYGIGDTVNVKVVKTGIHE